MQFVRELPYLMALTMIGVAMITGKMQAVEGIIGILGTHAARGYPHRAVSGSAVGFVIVWSVLRVLAPGVAFASSVPP